MKPRSQRQRKAEALVWAIKAVDLRAVPADVVDDLAKLVDNWKRELNLLRQPEYRGPAVTFAGQKLSTLRGRYVVFDRDLKTKGGDCFPAGTILVISGSHRGRLELSPASGPGWIRGVKAFGMKLIPVDAQVSEP